MFSPKEGGYVKGLVTYMAMNDLRWRRKLFLISFSIVNVYIFIHVYASFPSFLFFEMALYSQY